MRATDEERERRAAQPTPEVTPAAEAPAGVPSEASEQIAQLEQQLEALKVRQAAERGQNVAVEEARELAAHQAEVAQFAKRAEQSPEPAAEEAQKTPPYALTPLTPESVRTLDKAAQQAAAAALADRAITTDGRLVSEAGYQEVLAVVRSLASVQAGMWAINELHTEMVRRYNVGQQVSQKGTGELPLAA